MTSAQPRTDVTASQAGRDVGSTSVGELIGEVAQNLSTLMRQGLALAKAEVKVEAVKAGQATGMLGAAGLIVFGAGWLLSSLLPASAPEQQAATQVKDFATEHGRPVAQQLGEAGQQAAEQLRESAQQRAESVKDTAADAVSTVSGEAQAAASHVTSQTQESASAVREQASPGN